jgi:hypothetical protein
MPATSTISLSRGLLGTEDLTREEIEALLNRAAFYKAPRLVLVSSAARRMKPAFKSIFMPPIVCH